jgi:parallel beta-helix repeat protein
MNRLLLAICLSGLLVPAASPAATWHIKPDGTGDAPTVQAGLDSAATGDTVLVAAGTYYETIFWPFRNGITLLGAGTERTIIAGDRVEAVLYMVGSSPSEQAGGKASRAFAREHPRISEALMLAVPIDSTTAVKNLRFREGGDVGVVLFGASPIMESCGMDSTETGRGIHCLSGSRAQIRKCAININQQGGVEVTDCDSLLAFSDNTMRWNSASDGAGIYCYNSSPKITGNTIKWNSAHLGGGIYCEYGSPTIAGNTITENSSYSGTGIYCLGSSPVITGNTITSNSADYQGGGIYCQESSPTIAGNTVSVNSAENAGGGIYCLYASPPVAGNTITWNTASAGGGIYCLYGSPAITGNTIARNTASSGGGIACDYGSATMTSNILMWNSASVGGGISCSSASPAITGNIITVNSATSRGGGVYCYSGSATITGNVVAEDSALEGGGLYCHADTCACTITGNTICRNAATANGGALYCDSSTISVSFNAITQNAAGVGDAIYTRQSSLTISHSNMALNGWAIHNASYSTVPAAQDNWWGHSSGPWHAGGNPGGQGDSLSTYAWDFVPWLTEADTLAPPMPPAGLTVEGTSSVSVSLSWLPVPIDDLEGYTVWFDTDTLGYSYSDSLDVGDVTQYTVGNLQSEASYCLAVTCHDRSGERSWYSARVIAWTESWSGASGNGSYSHLQVKSASPNPFTSQIVLRYIVPKAGHTRVTVHDARGRQIRTLLDQPESAGAHSLVWDGKDSFADDSAPGIYYVRFESGDDLVSTKAVLMR